VTLYAGTTEQFRADAQMHRIAETLRAELAATSRNTRDRIPRS
jgi:hypothetical protein